MNKEKRHDEEMGAFIIKIELRIKKYQSKNFVEWHYWKEKLEELEPDNPILLIGFHGKPYTGGYYS